MRVIQWGGCLFFLLTALLALVRDQLFFACIFFLLAFVTVRVFDPSD